MASSSDSIARIEQPVYRGVIIAPLHDTAEYIYMDEPLMQPAFAISDPQGRKLFWGLGRSGRNMYRCKKAETNEIRDQRVLKEIVENFHYEREGLTHNAEKWVKLFQGFLNSRPCMLFHHPKESRTYPECNCKYNHWHVVWYCDTKISNDHYWKEMVRQGKRRGIKVIQEIAEHPLYLIAHFFEPPRVFLGITADIKKYREFCIYACSAIKSKDMIIAKHKEREAQRIEAEKKREQERLERKRKRQEEEERQRRIEQEEEEYYAKKARRPRTLLEQDWTLEDCMKMCDGEKLQNIVDKL